MAVKENEIEEADNIKEDILEAIMEPEDTSVNVDEENVTKDLENNNDEVGNENDPELIVEETEPKPTSEEEKDAFVKEIIDKAIVNMWPDLKR